MVKIRVRVTCRGYSKVILIFSFALLHNTPKNLLLRTSQSLVCLIKLNSKFQYDFSVLKLPSFVSKEQDQSLQFESFTTGIYKVMIIYNLQQKIVLGYVLVRVTAFKMYSLKVLVRMGQEENQETKERL